MTAARHNTGLSVAEIDSLISDLAEFTDDPLAFVMWAFPWGEFGTELAKETGPSDWQRERLAYIRDHIHDEKAVRFAVASGNDIGKSCLVAWLVLWAIATREDTRGVVTAGTGTQLKTKTWPELAKWYNLAIFKSLFTFTATSIHSADDAHQHTWRCDQVPWNPERPEAFQGLHNLGKRILLVFDEASQIHDKIWEAADGVLLDKDTQIIWGAFGNPTRRLGRFKDCFDKQAEYWDHINIDSRTVPIGKQAQYQEWIDLYGIDHDFVRVKVLGQFPMSDSIQFIGQDIIDAAQNAPATSFPSDPLIIGVDVARYGDAESVIVRRRGRDARTWPALRFKGLNTTELANQIASLIVSEQPDQVFIDEGGVGGGVVDQVRNLGHQCVGIQFGGKPGAPPNGTKVANKRAEMYVLLREWLRTGGAIETHDDLETQLIELAYGLNKRDEILLVSKEDMRTQGIASPDWADALALCFAMPVSLTSRIPGGHRHTSHYDPFAPERIFEEQVAA